MHPEKSSHDSACRARAQLPSSGWTYDLLEFLLEEAEIEADHNQHEAKNDSHRTSFNLVKKANR